MVDIAVYADAVDYAYLRMRLREAKLLLNTVLADSQLNIQTLTGQLIHAWLAECSPDPPFPHSNEVRGTVHRARE